MKKKIVIAGTLKPVDDVRAFEKIAQSILKTNKYEINIIGNSGKKESGHKGIYFIPHRIDRNFLLSRLALRYQITLKILKLTPDLLIVNTHELLWQAIFIKWICKCPIIYDIQEDYKSNLFCIKPSNPIKKALGIAIRFKERVTRGMISLYWLAEKVYEQDLTFTRGKSFVIENKAKKVAIPKAQKKQQVLFSGTISHYSQIILAIHCFQKLKMHTKDLTMKIIGQCHDRILFEELKALSKTDDGIDLEISRNPIPHSKITEAILTSTLGIISYQENVVNRKKIPTKLYEYSRYQLPYLIQKGTYWEIKSSILGGSIPIDFKMIDTEFVTKSLQRIHESFPKTYPIKETWESNEAIIYQSLITLLDEY